MSGSATEPGPAGGAGRTFMRAPLPVINIIAPTDSPTNNNIEPGRSPPISASTRSRTLINHNHVDVSSAELLDNAPTEMNSSPSDFKCDFSNWSSDNAKSLVSTDGLSLSSLQLQPPFEHELDISVDSPTNVNANGELTEFIGKAKKRRFYCRRGAVVLQRSPVGRYFQGERKLRLAAQQGDYTEVLKLLDEGINPNRGDDKGRTALHFAITKGFQEIVQLLLDRGADVNQKDGIGNTPLHLAAIGSHISMVTTLLQAGANVQVIDRGGHTPYHLALSRLQHLRINSSHEGITFRQDILQIMGMLKVYVSCCGQQEKAMQLEQMSAKLRETEKVEEVDILQDMLEGFTKMNLAKQ